MEGDSLWKTNTSLVRQTEKVGHRTPSQAKTHFAHFNGFGKVKWRPTCTHAEAHSQVTCADFSPVLECFAEVKKIKSVSQVCIMFSWTYQDAPCLVIPIYWFGHVLDRICGLILVYSAGIKYHILCHGVNSYSLFWVIHTWEILQQNPKELSLTKHQL